MPAIAPPTTDTAKAAKSRLQGELANSPIVGMGDYPYITHPILDGFPSIDASFMSALADACIEIAFPQREKSVGIDGIITVEAMGIPLAFLVAQRLRVPLHIARKKEYKVPGEIVVRRKTGYSESHIAFNGLGEGKSYWFVDSLLSSGATLKAAMLALKLAGARTGGSVFLISKMREDDATKLSQMTKAPMFALLTLEILSAAQETGGEARGFRIRVSDGFQVRA